VVFYLTLITQVDETINFMRSLVCMYNLTKVNSCQQVRPV